METLLSKQPISKAYFLKTLIEFELVKMLDIGHPYEGYKHVINTMAKSSVSAVIIITITAV